MGNNEAADPPKSDKTSSAGQEQPPIHPYPDWAAMQAYYGPGVAMPPPYFSTTVAAGHAPHPYMWGPQPLIAPFGTPYAAIYPHGGVYSHPSMPIGSHPQSQGITPAPGSSEAVVMATPLSMEMPAKSSSNKDKSLMKKLKGFDGLAVSMGNGNAGNSVGSDANGQSRSGDNSGDGSSDGSDGNNEAGGNKTQRKRSSEDVQASGDGKVETQANAAHVGETNVSSNMSLGVTLSLANVAGKPIGSTPGMDFSVAGLGKVKASGTPLPPATGGVVPGRNGVPSDLWRQDERELKRERRKQSNRESARRSRLRKQAETEELAMRVETLSSENMTLRSEISRLTKNSEKLRSENSALMEKLKTAQLTRSEEKIEKDGIPPVVVENFLPIIDSSSSVDRSRQHEDEVHENSSAKLHQLLDSNPRTDAVAAS